MNDLQWTPVKVKLKDLVPWEKNPRKISPKEKAKLAGSLREHGLAEVLTVNFDGVLINGHQRSRIMMEVFGGDHEVYVSKPNRQLTYEEVVKLSVRLNRSSGENDKASLAEFGHDLLLSAGMEDKELKGIFDLEMGLPKEGRESFVSELREENNYVVFAFDDAIDWQMITEFFKLTSVEALDSKKGYRRKGVGRIIKGEVLLEMIKKINQSK